MMVRDYGMSFWKKDEIDYQGCVNIFEIENSGDNRTWTKIGEKHSW